MFTEIPLHRKKNNAWIVMCRCMATLSKYNVFNQTMLFLLAVVIFSYTRSIPFSSDEGDNMLGAMHVANGLDIYKHFFSQHRSVSAEMRQI